MYSNCPFDLPRSGGSSHFVTHRSAKNRRGLRRVEIHIDMHANAILIPAITYAYKRPFPLLTGSGNQSLQPLYKR
jgi:hypothetical protein